MKRKPAITERAREGRKDMPGAEARMWSLLRDRRLANHKFRRQHPIGKYVVDFACVEAKLVVEIDGPSHDEAEQKAFDETRTAYLQRVGWRVVRFKNADVYHTLGKVEAALIKALTA